MKTSILSELTTSISIRRLPLLLGTILILSVGVRAAENREELVRDDRARAQMGGRWVYNDLEKAIALAKQADKPMLVVFRCPPCVAAREFDAQVVAFHPTIKEAMEKFVCVKIGEANGLDLSVFQFDYEQTFAIIFMNADKTIYGRFGTRTEQRDATKEMSLEGLAQAMAATLEIHKGYPANKASLAGKQGRPARYKTSEQYPSLAKYKSQAATEGKIVPTCLHCHQIRDAERLIFRSANQPMPLEELFPYPMPDLLGFHLDPLECATVNEVKSGSVAAKAGLQAGDEIRTLEGQPIVSTADVQWVLHNAPAVGQIKADVLRGGKKQTLNLALASGWREKSDIGWRVSTWDLRRMVTGGIYLEEATEEERAKAKLDKNSMALRAQHVGEYGEHAAAKKAGVKPDDIIVEWDGMTQRMTDSEVITRTVQKRAKGERIPITVVRGEQRLKFEIPMQ